MHTHIYWIDGGNDCDSKPCNCDIGQDHWDSNPYDDDDRPSIINPEWDSNSTLFGEDEQGNYKWIRLTK